MIFKRKKKVVTHSGSFHADDIFACATLSLYFKKHNIKYKVIRTRDEYIIEKADYVFDVGGIYDPILERFDHHQPEGAGRRENAIPYASFGLVWKKYGSFLCKDNEEVINDIDRRLAQPIDAIDNGISISEPADCSGIYEYGIHGIVSAYQNTWKDSENDNRQLKSFLELVSFFEGVLKREIEKSFQRIEMIDLIEESYQRSKSKEIIEIPYHVGVGSMMQVLNKYPEVMYVVAKSNKNWKVVAMRENPCTFENRKSMPKSWAGKRDRELQKVTGVSDAIFCHNSLWLVVAKSRLGARQLAELALID